MFFTFYSFFFTFYFTGGNPFWVDEISTFLLTYGVQEFISNLKNKGENNIKNSLVASLQSATLMDRRSSMKRTSFTTDENIINNYNNNNFNNFNNNQINNINGVNNGNNINKIRFIKKV